MSDAETEAGVPPLPLNARIIVAGAGAVGLYVGIRLAAGGRNVAFLGRRALVETTRSAALLATDRDGGEARLAPSLTVVSEDAAILSNADVVLVTTKSRDTAAMGMLIAAHARPTAVVVSLQNGLRNPERLRSVLEGWDVRAGMVPFNVVLRRPGAVHRATAGDLRVADGPGVGRRAGLAQLLSAPGLKTHGVADMSGVLWTKLLLNQNNALNALSGLPLKAQLADARWRRLTAACVAEGLIEARAARIRLVTLEKTPPRLLPALLRLPTPLFAAITARTIKADDKARSSMQDDLARRRPTEIDELQGEVSRRAHARGAAAPTCRAVATLIREAEAAGEGPPRLTPERVEEMAKSGRG
jgi:2-dehydropantoate 2-reductase